ncbi:MAG: hypothetical protein AAGB46_00790 [Verrucomicrobiota bacterium]
MEGLIIAVAELLLAPFIAGIAALCQLIASLISLALQPLFGTAAKPTKKKIKIPPVVIKWIRRVVLGSVALFSAALLVINFLLLDESIRFAVDKVENKTGFDIQYESVEGNLFTGSFTFTDLYLKQTLPDKPQLTIEAKNIAANLSVWNFILGRRVIDSASLSDASIALKTLPKQEEEEKKPGFVLGLSIAKDRLNGLTAGKPSLLNTPNYEIKDLQLEDVNIRVEDQSSETPTSYQIAINRYQARPLRSHFAIFDLLFRSNLDATLNSSRLEIINTEENGVRHTKWATKEIPAPVLASIIGGPFTLFEKGSVDVEVADQWETHQIEQIELDWKIKVADARARLPHSTPDLIKPLAQVWVDNINQNQEDWEFGFQLQLAESQFHGASSLNAEQIWQDSIPVFLKQTSDLTGFEESSIKNTTTKAFNALKGFLEKRTENN